ncbi:MAG: ribulose-phosphate 3-epimerase [Candidatus Tectomicrobia bacterium]|uniref:Ribulose-phosphate 3-epimerase n=1 Tax=Tectimicrobiota bacterium TaxID=2528274 RepID=A0A932FZU9_UNCTE|nr:ribulose-phosphate 3-epimerase [Candidatus Tectomicrobia bacterium]
MSDKKIAPSILSADLTRLAQEIDAAEKGGADWIHIDVMDGHFAPILTIGHAIVSAIRKVTKLPLDVHLMVDDPDRQIELFAEAGADILVVPIEACAHPLQVIRLIRDKGCKAGVGLNPATPLSALDYILPEIDLVTLLLVNPGFKGQKLLPGLVHKVRQLHEMIREQGLQVGIEADGGISLENIAQVAQAGAEIFVAGTAVFSTRDYGETIRKLRQEARG